MIELVDGARPERLSVVRQLFTEYSEWMGFDFCFQGFEEELASLPGVYAPPQGRIILAMDGANAAGVVALRPLPKKSNSACGETQHGAILPAEGVCEMKRLWVRPAYRGQGLGSRLASEVIEAGRAIGYHTMVLDTLERLQAATAIYLSMGFVPMEPYYANPIEGVIYLRLCLR